MKTLRPACGYIASDGKFFEEEDGELAAEHQRIINFREWCSDNICRGGEWSASMVAQAIIDSWIMVPRKE